MSLAFAFIAVIVFIVLAAFVTRRFCALRTHSEKRYLGHGWYNKPSRDAVTPFDNRAIMVSPPMHDVLSNAQFDQECGVIDATYPDTFSTSSNDVETSHYEYTLTNETPTKNSRRQQQVSRIRFSGYTDSDMSSMSNRSTGLSFWSELDSACEETPSSTNANENAGEVGARSSGAEQLYVCDPKGARHVEVKTIQDNAKMKVLFFKPQMPQKQKIPGGRTTKQHKQPLT